MNTPAPPHGLYRPPQQQPEETRTTRGTFWLTVALAGLFVMSAAVGAGVWFIRGMYETLPTFNNLQNIEPPLVSVVYGIDGSPAHEFSVERRIWVPLDRIPRQLVDAVIAIEDRRFYSHWGIDLKRIVGAVVVDLVRRDYAQGASTLTQQLARNVYLTARQSMTRKIREALTAVQLERYYTKREILELYLNQVYLGGGAYGVQAAAEQYFSKDVSELTLNECAVIAGTIQLPEYYRIDREKNRDRIIARKNTVLRGMRDMRVISAGMAEAAVAEPVAANPSQRAPARAPYFMEMIRQYVSQRYGDDVLYNGGLIIQSTLDLTAQDSAEAAVARHLPLLQARCNRFFLETTRAHVKLKVTREFFLAHFDSVYGANREALQQYPDSMRLRIAQAAVLGFEAATGEIRALVGGRNFAESKFNRAFQGWRQPGSAFKPFVYTAAIDNGFTPATVILDQPITLMTTEGEWRPENYNRVFLGPIPLRRALEKSNNIAAIQVLMKLEPQTVIGYAKKLGLTRSLPPVPSLAIGSCETSPVEIITAYGAFANRGTLVKPYFIKRIYDRNGRLLEENGPSAREVISPQTAFLMADMLTGVVRRGTAASIPGLGFTRPCGGKTGTTNDYSDAWFIGFTPQIVCGVWVGVDERRSLGAGVTGANGAIPIWVPAMLGLHKKLPVENFHRPAGIVTRTVCARSGGLAGRFCPETHDEYFKEETAVEPCDQHGAAGARQGIHRMFNSKTKPAPGKSKKPLMF